jgi:lipid kinase YegS
MSLRLILNGGKPTPPEIRDAVHQMRQRGVAVEVRVTWEEGDGERLAREACREGVKRVVAGGGDGTVSEVVNGLMAIPPWRRAALAILPLGTANDFATACGISAEPLAALELAAAGRPVRVDVVRVDQRHFLNAASSGFGAEVTASTPSELKRLLGSSAYALMAVIMALNAKPRECRFTMPGISFELSEIFSTFANGRQAGGGKVVAPAARIDDGLLDVMLVRRFPLSALNEVIREVAEPSSEGVYVSYHQTPWIELDGAEPLSVNLDGEPHSYDRCRMEVLPGELRLVVPAGCPLLRRSQPLPGPR